MIGGSAAVPIAPGSDESSGVVFYLIFGAGFAILSELIAALHRRSQRTAIRSRFDTQRPRNHARRV